MPRATFTLCSPKDSDAHAPSTHRFVGCTHTLRCHASAIAKGFGPVCRDFWAAADPRQCSHIDPATTPSLQPGGRCASWPLLHRCSGVESSLGRGKVSDISVISRQIMAP